MQTQLIHEADGQRTYALILATGDEIMDCLKSFASAEAISAAQFNAIGALSRAKIAYFDWEAKKYLPIPVEEQVEVASFSGDIAIGPDGKPAVHAHIVLGRRDGSALAGHLNEGHVRPTLEIVLTESPAYLHKKVDPSSGLALIRVE
jgi:predicted DNA-binding protein with PD1-like motif